MSSSRDFFLPVKVLGRVFRGKLPAFLRKEYEAGNLPMTGRLSALADARRFARWRSKLYQMDWGVNVQPPQDRPPEQALKYLARYTYRVAISNGRIEAIEGDGHHGRVTFWHKDHRHDKVWRRTRLPGVEFLRRFCTHASSLLAPRKGSCSRSEQQPYPESVREIPPVWLWPHDPRLRSHRPRTRRPMGLDLAPKSTRAYCIPPVGRGRMWSTRTAPLKETP